MSDKLEDLVEHFFGDPSVQRLVTSSASCNPLRICYPKEVNVSRFIAWLLDPSEGHGLGDQAIRSLLVRAWYESKDAKVPLPTRRFLAPSSVLTQGFSASLVTTEVALDGRSLDVLVIDDAGRNYIAIENKFGAQQSGAQLSHYRKHLEKLFPDFTGVHIFLDSRIASPDDPAWISIGYDWLSEFLMEAEERESIAPHVREALAQFRSVIEDEPKDAMIKSAYGRLVTDVACKHPDILGLMQDWSVSSSKGMRARDLAQLMQGRSTLEGRAMLRLFQLYWSRTRVWDDCIRQVQFGPFVSKLQDRFGDLLVLPKIVRSGFSLERWESLIDRQELDKWFPPAGVTVTQTGESFRVVTFINLSNVRAEKKDALRIVAAKAKFSDGRSGSLDYEQSFVRLRVRKDLTLERAVDESLSEMAKLDERLATVH
ncbi:PD-(D/E)XK nuclease family protein [Achromobacter xylosoxidans]|uniref:PDDEXK-like family protein n=1 Tax=Alcaligenes xylosoxydans xylosoxydans TaxID=85698 RepID=UPI000D19D140|nr:PD-(D/E)XK nuclease family protein [Achromobacter xylosoxidans]